MTRCLRYLTFWLAALLPLTILHAEEVATAQKGIRDSLQMLLPGIEPDSIEETPVKGLYEIVFGPRLVYMTADGRYLLQGSITDLETRENLTEPRLQAAKINAIEQVGTDNMLIYSPPEGTRLEHQINVFTDIDCGYCRKLHSEMSQYNNLGIEVRYLFYPRAGKPSKSYDKAVSVWCADDRHAAMNLAKAGKEIESRLGCDNPVEKNMMLGELIGVTGTPAIVLSDGELVPGYVPADRLKKLLDARAQAASQ